MNNADSKKLDKNSLEKLREQHQRGKDSLAAHQALINGLEYHLAKTDQLNEKLVERIIKCKESLGIAEDKIEEQEREIERLREKLKSRYMSGYVDGVLDRDYQRSHRKWALKEAVEQSNRAEKAEIRAKKFEEALREASELTEILLRLGRMAEGREQVENRECFWS